MASLSVQSSTTAAETTVNRVSAMTLVIPIKQELVPQLVVTLDGNGNPVISFSDGPQVRPVENLATAFGAVRALVATGEPMGLNRVGTIHYARWVVIDDGRTLLFCANFDGSLDQYLTDFMVIANTKTAPFMDIIWGNCVGYPGGEPTTFIDWARSWQVDTTLFFPTISDLTVRDIYWLRQFRHYYTEFDKLAQEVPDEQWPPELLAKYNELKTNLNAIDLSVVQ